MKCTDNNNQMKSTTLSLSSYSNSLPQKRANAELKSAASAAAAAASLYISSIQTPSERRELHLFGAALFFIPAPGSVFFPWAGAAAAAAVFWALSLGVFCAEVEVEAAG